MEKAESQFPLDIFAVKEYGLDEWQKYFFWPVSEEEYLKLFYDIEECLGRRIARGDVISKFFSIQFELRIEYANFLHALLVIQRLRDLGKEPFYSDRSFWYRNILEGKPVDVHISSLRPIRYDFRKKLKSSSKALVLSFLRNLRHVAVPFFSRSSESKVVFGSQSDLMKSYLKKMPGWKRFTCLQDWLLEAPAYDISDKVKEEIKRGSEEIASELSLISERYGIRLNKQNKLHIASFTERELKETARVFSQIKEKVGRSGKKIHLILSGTNNTLERALSMAVKECRGRVTTFIHGGDTGFRNVSISLEITTADDFVVYTKGSKALFEKIKARSPSLKNKPLNIISGDSDEYACLQKNFRKFRIPSFIRNIMLIGYPHNQWRRMRYFGGFSLIQLDLELRLVHFLNCRGYRVFYKAHPDRLEETGGIFEDRANVLLADFRKCLDKADLYLFSSVMTHAFAIALCTQKPVIALDISFKLCNPFPDAMDLLKKRCGIVNTWVDERNRILFDEDGLEEELRKEIRPPDEQFIRRFLFP